MPGSSFKWVQRLAALGFGVSSGLVFIYVVPLRVFIIGFFILWFLLEHLPLTKIQLTPRLSRWLTRLATGLAILLFGLACYFTCYYFTLWLAGYQ